jgi:hypothetical protein
MKFFIWGFNLTLQVGDVGQDIGRTVEVQEFLEMRNTNFGSEGSISFLASFIAFHTVLNIYSHASCGIFLRFPTPGLWFFR